MSIDSDVINFYNQWSNFVSILSFSWEDEYNPQKQTIDKYDEK